MNRLNLARGILPDNTFVSPEVKELIGLTVERAGGLACAVNRITQVRSRVFGSQYEPGVPLSQARKKNGTDCVGFAIGACGLAFLTADVKPIYHCDWSHATVLLHKTGDTSEIAEIDMELSDVQFFTRSNHVSAGFDMYHKIADHHERSPGTRTAAVYGPGVWNIREIQPGEKLNSDAIFSADGTAIMRASEAYEIIYDETRPNLETAIKHLPRYAV